MMRRVRISTVDKGSHNAPINVKPHPPVWGGWGFDLVESQIPHPGDELLGQIPYIPRPSEVGDKKGFDTTKIK